MYRCAFLCGALLLGACETTPPPQTSEQTAMANLVYERIMDAAKSYSEVTGTKVMAACIRWPRDGQSMAISGYAAYITDRVSDGAIKPAQLGQAALDDCRDRADADSGCTCQFVDRNGSNVLYVR